jgi:hypothetical protein
LHRIEESAFAESDLKTIEIPASLEVVGKSCLSKCKSLTSVTVESNSKLQRIEESSLAESDLKTIDIPSSVEVILLSLCSRSRSSKLANSVVNDHSVMCMFYLTTNLFLLFVPSPISPPSFSDFERTLQIGRAGMRHESIKQLAFFSE